jgi:hypothetical protein
MLEENTMKKKRDVGGYMEILLYIPLYQFFPLELALCQCPKIDIQCSSFLHDL